MEPLTIIIITHNRLEYTKRTIDSLLTTSPKGTRFLVWDNKSDEPGMRQYLSNFAIDNPHDAYIVLCSDNLGWGEAVNRMLLEVKTEYVLISNNDVIYKPNWYETLLELYAKYPNIGILGTWRHTSHGIREDRGDLLVLDDCPAVGWLLKMSVIKEIGDFATKGPCSTKGGNGEDTNYTMRAHDKRFLVACSKPDTSLHLDGY